MAFNSNGRTEIEKKAKNDGYRWNSDGNKMINNNGGSLSWSSSGGSLNLNGSKYTNSSDAKKSRNW